jgi:hypothetical protein
LVSKYLFNFSSVQPCRLKPKQCASSFNSNKPIAKAKLAESGALRASAVFFSSLQRFSMETDRLGDAEPLVRFRNLR